MVQFQSGISQILGPIPVTQPSIGVISQDLVIDSVSLSFNHYGMSVPSTAESNENSQVQDCEVPVTSDHTLSTSMDTTPLLPIFNHAQ